MNSYQAYQHQILPNNRIRQNDMRLNYVYNRANQNIDHLRDNFNNSQNDAPIRITKNVYRNESSEISSILNKNLYNINQRFNESNSSNNYNSTNYSSFQSNINENKYPNNNDINRQPQRSDFYNRNNSANYNEMNNYQKMPMYPRNSNINSMNYINRNNMNINRNNNINSNEMVNFNGLNLNIGSRINNSNHHNNYPQNYSFENQFRRSNYSNRSENINIGNNHYNINLSSVTSQDIFQSFEKQKKEHERKKIEEYSNFLKQQIQEKNNRKELEKQKKLKEELEFEEKYGKEFQVMQQKDLDEKLNMFKNNKNNEIKNNDEQIIKKNSIESDYKNDENNNLDKNIIETLRKNQYPLINDIKEIESINNRNRKKNYKNENIEQKIEKLNTHSSMIKSGINIVEGNKSRENFYQRETNENNLNNSNKKVDSNKETELYLDKIIQKTDRLTQALNKPQVNDDQRMKDILKVIENNKNEKISRKNTIESKNNFTPDKNNVYKNKFSQDVNLGAINFHSKYENYDNINNDNKNNKFDINNNNKYIQNKSKYTSNIKNEEETDFKESMKGNSEFITASSRKRNENITGINLFNNPNNHNKNSSLFSERKKDKKYIIKDDLIKNLKKSDNNSNINEVKDSLISNMKMTFGIEGDLKFSNANNNPDNNYSKKVNESISTFNDTNNQKKSIKQYTFGENFQKEKNDSEISKKDIKQETNENNEEDEDDEEKYDIKVNSENDINYENMLKSTQKSDLKFLDFDNFCDTENDNEQNKNKKRKKKKKKSSIKKNNENIDDINENDELCNITISDEDKEKNDKSTKVNESSNKLSESKKVQMQLNFFSDSITKGISHKRNDKSIFKKNEENNEDNINLVSKQSLDKNKDTQDDKKDELNNNILEESDELKDSYCDNILKNIDKFRGELQDE